jgi:cobalt/nickel transport system permease protein
MHIPDGFLDLKTCLASGVLAVSGIGLALRRARQTVPTAKVPLMGLTAAFVFASQMVNFPVAGGTSGHLMGGVLAAVLLGPSAAIVVLTAVLLVQCLMFADGGVMALGANLFNMAIVGPLSGYALYRLMLKLADNPRGMIAAASFAAWCAILISALCCAGQLACSGIVPWSTVFPAMATVHMLIGVGEGLITGLVIAAIARFRPEFLAQPNGYAVANRSWAFVGYALLLTAGLALFLAPFASPWPDGLERVAAQLGFEGNAVSAALFKVPFADYTIPGMKSMVKATLIAGGLGTIITFSLSWVLAHFLVPRGSTGAPANDCVKPSVSNCA